MLQQCVASHSKKSDRQFVLDGIYINVNPEEFQKFKNDVGDEPVVMLNLLKYKRLLKRRGKRAKRPIPLI